MKATHRVQPVVDVGPVPVAEPRFRPGLLQGLGRLGHEVVAIDLRVFGGSALTADIPVPKGRSEAEIERQPAGP